MTCGYDATGLPGAGAWEGARARGWTGSCGRGHTTTTNYVVWTRRVRPSWLAWLEDHQSSHLLPKFSQSHLDI